MFSPDLVPKPRSAASFKTKKKEKKKKIYLQGKTGPWIENAKYAELQTSVIMNPT